MPPVLRLSTAFRTPVFTLQTKDMQVKKIYGAAYHGATQSWRFPAFFPVHTFVLSDIANVLPAVEWDAEVVAHEVALAEAPRLPDDFSFFTDPYQHQMQGLLHLQRNLRAGLFYSPGLGKCKITVDLQRLTGDHLLILCPRVMLHTWAEEFVKHGGIEDVVVIDGYNKKKKMERIAEAVSTDPVATVVTYTLAALYPEELLKIPYTMIVADESHQMKTPFAKRTRAAAFLAQRAHRRVLLSGTPSLGSPFDMYAQLRFLGKYLCTENWWAFRKLFGVFPEWERDEAMPKQVIGYKSLDVMNARVNLVCLKKTKEECLDLPEQQIIDVEFTLYGHAKKEYNKLVVERADTQGQVVKAGLEAGELDHSSGVTLTPYVYVPEVISLLNKLDQVSSGFMYLTDKNPELCSGCEHVSVCVATEVQPYTPKCKVVQKTTPPVVSRMRSNVRLETLQGLLETILADSDNKVIIWATYRVELDDIEATIKGLGADYVRVEGGMSGEALNTCRTKFNADAKCKVYIGQVSTGVGITLNAANYTVYYKLPWSLDHYLQSLDRNYRIGQDRKVTVYRLIARHTLDPAKVVALKQKVSFSNLVTSRSVCATCTNVAHCFKYKVNLYGDGCIYERSMMRDTAKVSLLP